MEVLLLVPIGFVGSVFWFVSAEITAISYGSMGHHPLLVGSLAALGQCTMYIVLFHGGTKLVRRWHWLASKTDHLRDMHGARLARGYLSVSGVSAVIGIPPMVALAALANAFGARFWHFWPIALAGRTVRFTLLAAIGNDIELWWNSWTGCS